jgi:hypothetical protein
MIQMRSVLAVLALDLAQGVALRRAVGLPRQHLIGMRKAVGSDDQYDPRLDAVVALVTAAAEAAFVVLVARLR